VQGKYVAAANIFRDLVEAREFDDFLTLRVYPSIVTKAHARL
jgi:hypothetical protein